MLAGAAVDTAPPCATPRQATGPGGPPAEPIRKWPKGERPHKVPRYPRESEHPNQSPGPSPTGRTGTQGRPKLPASYLRVLPVEADELVVFEHSHVALVLGELGPLAEDLLRLGLVSRHHVDHFTHGVSQ